MNRRIFFGSIGGGLLAKIASSIPKRKAVKYGLMTVNRIHLLRNMGVDLVCYLDGKEISKHCREAHDIEGWALIYKQNEDGQHYVEPSGSLAMEIKTGSVEFRNRA